MRSLSPKPPHAMMRFHQLQDEWLKAQRMVRIALSEPARADRAAWLAKVEAELLKRRTHA